VNVAAEADGAAGYNLNLTVAINFLVVDATSRTDADVPLLSFKCDTAASIDFSIDNDVPTCTLEEDEATIIDVSSYVDVASVHSPNDCIIDDRAQSYGCHVMPFLGSRQGSVYCATDVENDKVRFTNYETMTKFGALIVKPLNL